MIPTELVWLKKQLASLMPPSEKDAWITRVEAATNPSADLTKVWPQWITWLLTDTDCGLAKFATTDEAKQALARMADRWRGASPPPDAKEIERKARVYAARTASGSAAMTHGHHAAHAAIDATKQARMSSAEVEYARNMRSAASRLAAVAWAKWAAVSHESGWYDMACDKLVELLETAPCV